MKLKKIVLQGFKSFCDRTVINFDSAVVAVVGPNGCGKSNISDAIRWVLGEQSAKSLRGDKMYDVIFSGSHKRKPVNLAQVSIVFSEVGDHLPVDYEEVEITRKLYRNGDSCYLINNKEVRLKDIHNLLMNSGLGKDAYAILEQGKMDEVIVSSPQERRTIFEEAAGIRRFKQSKKEALKKLEAMESNIVRLEDIAKEVEKQRQVLEKQAEKAKAYKTDKADFEHLDKSLLYQRYKQAKEILAKLDSSLEQAEQAVEANSEQSKLLDKALTQAIEDLGKEEEGYHQQNEKLFEKKRTLELVQAKEENLKKAIVSLKNKQTQIKEEVQNFSQDSKEEQKQQKENIKKLEQLSKQVEKAALKYEQLKSDLKQRQQAHEKMHKELQILEETRTKLFQALTKIEARIQENKLRKENNQEKLTQFQARKKILSNQSLRFEKLIEEKQEQVTQLSHAIDKSKEAFGVLEKTFLELQATMKKVQQEQAQLKETQSEAQAKLKVLEQIKASQEGLSAGAKALLELAGKKGHAFYQKLGLVSDKIKVSQDMSRGVASVLKEYEHTLYVEDEKTLKAVYAHVLKEKLDDLSLCLLDQVLQDNLALVSSTQVFSEQLSQVKVVDELDLSLLSSKIVKESQVTKQGALINQWGVLWINSGKKSNRFVRDSEMRDLEKQLKSLEQDKQQLDARFQELSQEKDKIEKDKNLQDRQVRSLEMKLVEQNFSLQRARADLGEVSKQQEKLEKTYVEIDQAQQLLLSQGEELQQEQQKQAQAHQEQEQQLKQKRKDWEKEQEGFKEQEKLFEQAQENYETLKSEQESCQRQVAVFEAKQKEGLKHLDHLNQENKKLGEDLEQTKQELLEVQESKKGHADALKQEKDALKLCEQAIVSKKSGIEQAQKQISKNQDDYKSQEKNKTKLAIDKAQHESSCETWQLDLHERYGLDFSSINPEDYTLKAPLKEAEKNLLDLRKRIEAAGDVNMTSIEAFDQLNHRKSYLEKQMGDLGFSKDELLKLIEELDDQSRTQFAAAMEIIRENFRKNFSILFNGGEADLRFTDSQDVLESGIDIIAKPPGKNMRSISLLSGGEKCMTAIGLLFAIFEFKPAPFCVLDEIDAPLDDSNVGRFVETVKQYVEKTQFVVITHNKRTMAMADVLVGVSMHERGVSKLLSMDFQRAQKLVAVS